MLKKIWLNLSLPEPLWWTLGSPWTDRPVVDLEPDGRPPESPLQPAPRLTAAMLAKMQPDSLFYAFYGLPGDEVQFLAAAAQRRPNSGRRRTSPPGRRLRGYTPLFALFALALTALVALGPSAFASLHGFLPAGAGGPEGIHSDARDARGAAAGRSGEPGAFGGNANIPRLGREVSENAPGAASRRLDPGRHSTRGTGFSSATSSKTPLSSDSSISFSDASSSSSSSALSSSRGLVDPSSAESTSLDAALSARLARAKLGSGPPLRALPKISDMKVHTAEAIRRGEVAAKDRQQKKSKKKKKTAATTAAAAAKEKQKKNKSGQSAKEARTDTKSNQTNGTGERKDGLTKRIDANSSHSSLSPDLVSFATMGAMPKGDTGSAPSSAVSSGLLPVAVRPGDLLLRTRTPDALPLGLPPLLPDPSPEEAYPTLASDSAEAPIYDPLELSAAGEATGVDGEGAEDGDANGGSGAARSAVSSTASGFGSGSGSGNAPSSASPSAAATAAAIKTRTPKPPGRLLEPIRPAMPLPPPGVCKRPPGTAWRTLQENPQAQAGDATGEELQRLEGQRSAATNEAALRDPLAGASLSARYARYPSDASSSSLLPLLKEQLRLTSAASRRPESSVTVVTQLSLERLAMLRNQCAAWPDRLAAAVYVPLYRGRVISTDDAALNGTTLRDALDLIRGAFDWAEAGERGEASDNDPAARGEGDWWHEGAWKEERDAHTMAMRQEEAFAEHKQNKNRKQQQQQQQPGTGNAKGDAQGGRGIGSEEGDGTNDNDDEGPRSSQLAAATPGGRVRWGAASGAEGDAGADSADANENGATENGRGAQNDDVDAVESAERSGALAAAAAAGSNQTAQDASAVAPLDSAVVPVLKATPASEEAARQAAAAALQKKKKKKKKKKGGGPRLRFRARGTEAQNAAVFDEHEGHAWWSRRRRALLGEEELTTRGFEANLQTGAGAFAGGARETPLASLRMARRESPTPELPNEPRVAALVEDSMEVSLSSLPASSLSSSSSSSSSVRLPPLSSRSLYADESSSAARCALDVTVVAIEYESLDDASLYPYNAVRNRALALAQTDAVVLLDVDFVPSGRVAERWRADVHARRAALRAMRNDSLAFVLPAFETASDDVANVDLPLELAKEGRGAEAVARAFRAGRLAGFQMSGYYAGHGPTDHERWARIALGEGNVATPSPPPPPKKKKKTKKKTKAEAGSTTGSQISKDDANGEATGHDRDQVEGATRGASSAQRRALLQKLQAGEIGNGKARGNVTKIETNGAAAATATTTAPPALHSTSLSSSSSSSSPTSSTSSSSPSSSTSPHAVHHAPHALHHRGVGSVYASPTPGGFADGAYAISPSQGYEPYVLLLRSRVPWYDERFRGYGRDKIVHVAHVIAQGARLFTLPEGFAVHVPHPRTATFKATKALGQWDRLRTLYMNVLKELKRGTFVPMTTLDPGMCTNDKP